MRVRGRVGRAQLLLAQASLRGERDRNLLSAHRRCSGDAGGLLPGEVSGEVRILRDEAREPMDDPGQWRSGTIDDSIARFAVDLSFLSM